MRKIKIIMFTIGLLNLLGLLSCRQKEPDINDNSKNEEIKETASKNENQWSEEFTTCMNEAKKSEEEKNWGTALYYYYYALEVCANFNEADIAYKAYKNLADVIEKGTPGPGTFDTFSNYEEWKKLLICAELLGNTFFPYEIYFGHLEMTNLDMQKKTADYMTNISFTYSLGYQKTIGVISKGYDMTDKKGWNDLPEKFPGTPITDDSLYINNLRWQKGKVSAFSFPSSLNPEISIGGLQSIAMIPYEGVFTISDKNGTVYCESEPYILGTREESVGQNELEFLFGGIGYGGILKFKGVPQEGIQAIEKGSAIITLKEVNLIHGEVKADFNLSGTRYIEGGSREPVFVLPTQVHNQGDIRMSKAKYLFALEAQGKTFNPPYKLNNMQVHCVFFDYAKLCEILNGSKGMRDINMRCVLCNELSRLYGKKPGFVVGESSESCDFINNKSTISRNYGLGGFWLPDSEQLEKYVGSSQVAENLPAIEKSSLLFGGDRYNYFTTDADFLADSAYLMLCYLQ
jgi:hypothetical protein